MGSLPSLAQCVKGSSIATASCRLQLKLRFSLWPYAAGAALKKTKKKKKEKKRKVFFREIKFSNDCFYSFRRLEAGSLSESYLRERESELNRKI